MPGLFQNSIFGDFYNEMNCYGNHQNDAIQSMIDNSNVLPLFQSSSTMTYPKTFGANTMEKTKNKQVQVSTALTALPKLKPNGIYLLYAYPKGIGYIKNELNQINQKTEEIMTSNPNIKILLSLYATFEEAKDILHKILIFEDNRLVMKESMINDTIIFGKFRERIRTWILEDMFEIVERKVNGL